MTRRSLTLLGALLVTAVPLAACTGGGHGPLGDGGTPGQQCMPSSQGRPVTVGLFDLRNSGSSLVTIQSVRLGSPHGLKLTEAWLVPMPGGVNVVGVGWPYPPGNNAAVRAVWAQRKPAVGGAIRPRHDPLLVFGLTRTTSRDGHSAGPLITYTAGGNSYTLQEQTGLVVSARASCA